MKSSESFINKCGIYCKTNILSYKYIHMQTKYDKYSNETKERINIMKFIPCDTYEEMSKVAAEMIAAQINEKPDTVLGLATGSTPVGTYNELAIMNKEGKIDFKNVKTWNLDEYYPIAPEHDQSYRYFMNDNLFNHINIDIANTHVLNGLAKDPAKECAEYDAAIEAAGGIDLQVLGIGQNGHIAFNEPGGALDSATHLENLTQNTLEANSRFFATVDEVPKQALTMGLGEIMKARKIILLANGANKHDALIALLNCKEVTKDLPASVLINHPDVTIICESEAYGK